jgi:D-alanyl-D-alanine carboxypeptidase
LQLVRVLLKLLLAQFISLLLTVGGAPHLVLEALRSGTAAAPSQTAVPQTPQTQEVPTVGQPTFAPTSADSPTTAESPPQTSPTDSLPEGSEPYDTPIAGGADSPSPTGLPTPTSASPSESSASGSPTASVSARAATKATADVRKGAQLDEPYTVRGIVVVSKDHLVSKNYPKKGPGVDGVTAETDAAITAMFAAAKKAGYTLEVSWGYRSYEEQEKVYKRNVTALGPDQDQAAPPGASEHHTGLAVDIHSGSYRQYAFGTSKAGQWVAANCWKYGFIMRYPDGKTDITGFAYEPWHFRYIGKADAKAFADDPSLTLEEYLGIA